MDSSIGEAAQGTSTVLREGRRPQVRRSRNVRGRGCDDLRAPWIDKGRHMNFELETYHRNIPDSELVTDLQRVASELRERAYLQHVAPELRKKSVTAREYDEMGTFCSSALARRFGSWNAALEKAGLQETGRAKVIPDEELFRNLEEIWTRLGRQPRCDELTNKVSTYSKGTYVGRFGGWRKALEAFISYVNNEERAAANDEIESLKVEPIPTRKTPRTIKGGKASLSSGSAESRQQGPRNINWRLRFIVMRRDAFKCKVCGRTPATDSTVILHVDHIEAWSKGGRTVLENLQTLCSICNIGKSDLEFKEAR